MSDQPKWKKFEQIIADIQQRLLPDAKVIHDYKFKDQDDNAWQIDVFIEQTIGMFTYRTIIECKDYKRSVSRDKIEGFPLKMRHVKAHAGIVISTSGFSESAKAFAKAENFVVMDFNNATQVDWNNLLGDGAWLNIIKPRDVIEMEYMLKVETSDWFTIPFNTMIFDEQNNPIGTIQKRVFEDILYHNNILVQYVTFKIEALTQDMFLHNQDNDEYIPIRELAATGSVIHEMYNINLNLNEGEVITDASTDKIIYRNLKSASIDVKNSINNLDGQIISPEEFSRMQRESIGNFIVDMKNLKQYIRVSFTQKLKNNTPK